VKRRRLRVHFGQRRELDRDRRGPEDRGARHDERDSESERRSDEGEGSSHEGAKGSIAGATWRTVREPEEIGDLDPRRPRKAQ